MQKNNNNNNSKIRKREKEQMNPRRNGNTPLKERERMTSLYFVFAVYETPQGLSNINSVKCSFTEVMLHKKRKKKAKQTNSYLTDRY